MSCFEAVVKAYAEIGVDVNRALDLLDKVSLSIPCWQGDDVGGFEHPNASLVPGAGIQATGSFPGKARTLAELRDDARFAFSLIPGKNHRFNLHAIYGDFGTFADRDAIVPTHFQSWIEWAKSAGIALDFNPTLFSHPKASSNFTLSSKDPAIRSFWIEHVKKCRRIAAEIGKQQGSPCVNNLWIPDGFKDTPVDRAGHRNLLKESLDAIYAEQLPKDQVLDAVEGKLFGIGAEAYTVGSHDFYLGYAARSGVMLCMDTGHFHPTESVADKVSAVLPYVNGLLLHMSRPLRWDSDHVVVLNDEVAAVAEEVTRADAWDRIHIALDFFDASINRVGAWVIGARAVQKALLLAFLQPRAILLQHEEHGRFFERLALLERLKAMPWGAVWDRFCERSGVPSEAKWADSVSQYEHDVLTKRF
eukprot:TRINITY_DN3033_c0_g2_i1.p1 TRINITY_DN3033_c0_g2~~TRINITY_DN3033_c0_g2_i1.p1  ORF type:complete len:418 (+),score=129.35 TRINITY_DN3033_c0_g2_i1:577-1830(+)